MKAFGTDFVVSNDVRQPLVTLSATPTGKPYTHLATVHRGLREYMAYCDEDLNQAWVEVLDPKQPWLLERIDSDAEWNDVVMFLHSKGLLEIITGREMKIAPAHVINRIIV